MAAVLKNNAFAGSVSAITTGLNALAAAARAISSAIDNSSNLDLFADVELNCTFASSPTAGKLMTLYVVTSIDAGATYEDGDATVTPSPRMVVGTAVVRSVGTAQVLHFRDIELPPGFFKFMVSNDADQALSATGHTLKYNTHNLQAV